MLENDFRCFLRDIGHPGATALLCDEPARNHPTFHRAHSTGVTHPDYPVLRTAGGSLSLEEPLAPSNIDLGVLLLERPVLGVAPLPTAPFRDLDAIDKSGVTLLTVGYGGAGVRRIAAVGAIRTVTDNWVMSTQHNSNGQDSAYCGDAGSPLFLVQNDVVGSTVSGVFTPPSSCGGSTCC